MKKVSSELYSVREVRDLKDMINQSVSIFSDKEAFRIRNRNKEFVGVTYSDFKHDIDSLGTAFLSLGLKHCKIALMSENRYEWCTTYLATVNGTGVIVPIDKELHEDEIINILTESNAAAFVVSNRCLKSLKNVIHTLPDNIIIMNMDADDDDGQILSYSKLIEQGRADLDNGNRRFLDAEVDPEVMSMLLFTSGTTGMSKGVMLSHRNITSNIMAIRKTVYVDENDSALSILPLHHTYECTIGFLTLIYSGACITFSDGLRYIAKNLVEVSPTIIVTVPLLLEKIHVKIITKAKEQKHGLIKLKFGMWISKLYSKIAKKTGNKFRRNLFSAIHESLGGKLRLVITGAAAIDPAVSHNFRLFGLKVLQGYGLTECSPLVLGNTDLFNKDNSVGLPVPGTKVKIFEPNEYGIGEIIVNGPNVMLGYYNNIDETKKNIVNGWFHSGDLGKVDKDGFFKITGRIKNIIVTKNGKNIYPEEMEYILNSNPYIKESLVWGKIKEKTDELVVNAQIFPNFDAIKEKLKLPTLTRDDVFNFISDEIKKINSKLPLYKNIRGFDIREIEFVKTTTKKIKRYLENGMINQS